MKKERPGKADKKPRVSLAELDSYSGREIEGIEDKPEKFMRLRKGDDFIVVQKNNRLTSDRKFEDFIVFISPSMGTETKVIEAPHWRAINDSSVHSRIVLPKPDGSIVQEHFYGVSTKGIGYLKPSAKGLDLEAYDSWTVDDQEGINDRGYKVLGMISKEEALGGQLIEKSERLTAMGLRTELYWGMTELVRIPFQGKLMSVDELRDDKVISPRKSFHPYEVVRVFKMNNRIAEADKASTRRNDLFSHAFDIFNREKNDKGMLFPDIRIGNREQEQIFFAEFFRRMGANMGILLSNGLDHGYLHSANVTLAAEIADVGTIENWRKEKKREKDRDMNKKYSGVRRSHLKDMRDIAYDLRILINAGTKAGLAVGSKEDLRIAFFEGFESRFNPTLVAAEETDAQEARTWMKKIFQTVVIEGNSLPSLLHYEVEDWEI